MITLHIDGREVTVAPGTSILAAARQLGVTIPVLCHHPRLRPVGVCRLCVVDVGERVLAPACARECAPGMAVQTHTPELRDHRRVLLQLLLADYPEQSQREAMGGDDALLALARELGVDTLPFPDGTGGDTAAPPQPRDDSSPVIAVDPQACILCDRCLRACDEVQHNDVMGRTGKGYTARIAFDLDRPMGQSHCVSCGECLAVCPTSALTNRALHGVRIAPKAVPPKGGGTP